MKKTIIICFVSFFIINTVAYAANIDIYSGIINSIVAVKNAVLKTDSGMSKNTNEAIAKLDNYLKDYKLDIKTELESYKKSKANDANKQVNDKVDETIKKLETDKSKLIADYKKEIDTQIESELEKELQKLEKHYN
jgi:gas vesicle protein